MSASISETAAILAQSQLGRQNGKIWVEEDSTDLTVVDDLLAAGILKPILF